MTTQPTQTARVFHRDQLDAWGVPFDLADDPATAPEGTAVELHHEQTGTRRWVSVHELVFRAPDDGKAYRVTYEQGLTEQQDGTDEWSHRDHVVGELVEEYDRTVKAWRRVADRPAEPTHTGTDPTHGGLTTHRGTRDQCTGPDCGPDDTRRFWIAVDVPAADLDDHIGDALTHAADRAAAVLQEERGYEAQAWHATETHNAQQPTAPGWTLTPDTLDTFLRALVNELDYDLHKSWESNEETGEDDYPKLTVEAGKMLDAITAPPAEEPRTPAVGDQYVKRAKPDAGRIVTVNNVWTAKDGHTAVAYEWRDDKPGQCGSACPLDVFHRTYEAQQ